MFSCEFWEIPKNSFFTEHLWATASEKHLPTAATAFFGNCLVKAFFTSFVLFYETKIKGCSNQSRLSKNVSHYKVLGEDRGN